MWFHQQCTGGQYAFSRYRYLDTDQWPWHCHIQQCKLRVVHSYCHGIWHLYLSVDYIKRLLLIQFGISDCHLLSGTYHSYSRQHTKYLRITDQWLPRRQFPYYWYRDMDTGIGAGYDYL